MRARKPLSRLVPYQASALNPDTGDVDVWTVHFVGNRKEDRLDWLKMAHTAGFQNIRLTKRVKP